VRAAGTLALAVVIGGMASAAPLAAQGIAGARAGIVVDSSKPPISPRRAFLYSLAVPGLGQARLDRSRTGAGFFLVEALAIAMLHRSVDDLRLARAARGDSVPLRYEVDAATGIAQLDALGNPRVAAWERRGYSDELVKARRLQVEDWSALLVFTHLIAGAEAFVSAQLWDLPQYVRLQVEPGGRRVGVRAAFGGAR